MIVTPDDVAVALGRTDSLSDAESAQWDMWISDALMLISARLVGTGTGQVASLDDLDQDRLAYVVREAAKAQVQRPDDATTVDVSVDDGRVSKTYRSSAGRVTIRDEWWALLSDDSTSGGAFSIIPSGGTTVHLPWCALMFGAAEYCSCGADIAGAPIYEGAYDW